MSSSQRVVQHYLDRHGISKLFEEMMANLIKDMPNEPIAYLIKVLQKHLKKKKIESPLSPPLSRGMGLTGSSIPKKHNNDPQVVLPGSKAVSSAYGKFDIDSIQSEDNMRSSKDRHYDKPWQVNSRGHKNKKEARVEHWDGETKVHGVEEIFEQNVATTKLHSPLSRSLPITSSKKDTTWKEKPKKEEKLSQIPANVTAPPVKYSASISDEELMMDSRKDLIQEQTRKQTLSPHEYSRVKRHSSKKKAAMQKRKLQVMNETKKRASMFKIALLSNEDNQNSKQDNVDSSDDEAVDIIESMQDLEGEGVSTKSTGYKHVTQRTVQTTVNTNVTVGVCSKCARVIGEDKRLRREDSYSDGDIESVSQIDTSKPFKPRWPILSDSEGETQVEEEKLRPKSSKASVERVSFKSLEERSVKSDFFEGNSPLRKKTKQLVLSNSSDSESMGTFAVEKQSPFTRPVSPKKKGINKKQVWKQQTVDSNSDEDVAKNSSFSQGNKRTGVGFKLKDANRDDDSDFL